MDESGDQDSKDPDIAVRMNVIQQKMVETVREWQAKNEVICFKIHIVDNGTK